MLAAAYESGLSGPGRLHDLCVSLEAASPGEIKQGGQGWTISAGYASTPFGVALIEQSRAAFAGCPSPMMWRAPWEEMSASMAKAEWIRADKDAQHVADRIFTTYGERVPIRAHVRGSDFQVKVWRALLRIPYGSS